MSKEANKAWTEIIELMNDCPEDESPDEICPMDEDGEVVGCYECHRKGVVKIIDDAFRTKTTGHKENKS